VAAQGGFDIVVTNPPYVRQEQLGANAKERLRRGFPEVPATADLYVYFFALAQQLLRPGGVGCLLSSNKWLRATYGAALRRELTERQALRQVHDFGDQALFPATAYPALVVWQQQPPDAVPTAWTGVGRAGIDRRRMEKAGPRLGELVGRQMYRGILTGLNAAFHVDRRTAERLVTADARSADLLKPLLRGQEVRRFELQPVSHWLVWTYAGVPLAEYPAVKSHLRRFEARARARRDQGEHWWELRACRYYDVFGQTKIVYPEIARGPRFVIDHAGYFPADTVHVIASDDWYLLGVLNSATAWHYLADEASTIRGGYVRCKPQYLARLPVPVARRGERSAIARLARRAQELRAMPEIGDDNGRIERELDERVAALYGF
jgi:hypothetical protein